METSNIIFIAVGVIALIIIIVGYQMKCPECNKWWSRKNKGSIITDQRKEKETVTRVDTHRDREGKKIGETQRKEQIKVQYTYYENYHFCKNCSHKWTTNSVTRREL